MYFVVTWQQICWILNARPESNKVSVNKITLQINNIASFCFDESKTSRYISLNTLAFIIFILYQLWSFQLSPVVEMLARLQIEATLERLGAWGYSIV